MSDQYCDGCSNGNNFRATPEWIHEAVNTFNVKLNTGEEIYYGDFIETLINISENNSSKTTNHKKAINVSNKFVKYGDKTIHLNDIIVYTKDPKEKQYYRRVRDIYTNCGNVYISAGLNSFPEILFDYIKIINPQDLSIIDILKMFTYEIRYGSDFYDELVEIYTNIINKKSNKDKPVDNSDSEKTYAGFTKDELRALGWYLLCKSNDI